MSEESELRNVVHNLTGQLLQLGGIIVSEIPAGKIGLLSDDFAAEFLSLDAAVVRIVECDRPEMAIAAILSSRAQDEATMFTSVPGDVQAGDGVEAEPATSATVTILTDRDNPRLGPSDDLDIVFGSHVFGSAEVQDRPSFGIWLTSRRLLPVVPDSMAFSDRAARLTWAELAHNFGSIKALGGDSAESERQLLDELYPHVSRSDARRRIHQVVNAASVDGQKAGVRSLPFDKTICPVLEVDPDGRTTLSPRLNSFRTHLKAILDIGEPGDFDSSSLTRNRGLWFAARMFPFGTSVWVDPYLANAAHVAFDDLVVFLNVVIKHMSPLQDLRLVAKGRNEEREQALAGAVSTVRRQWSSRSIEVLKHTSESDRLLFHDRHLISMNTSTVIVLPTADRLIGHVPDLGNYVEVQSEENRTRTEELRTRFGKMN